MRFLSGRGVTLTHSFLDDETVMVVPSVSVTVRDSSGATVYTGDATNASDVWSVSLPAQPLGVYTVDWVAGTTATDQETFEVVGGFLFTVPEARASDIDLTDTVRFPTDAIKHYRQVIEQEFQTITGRSFTKRLATVKITGDDTTTALARIYDATAIKAITDKDGLTVDLTGWSIDRMGMVTAPFELYDGDVYTLTLEYGITVGIEDAKRAALLRLRSLLTAERSGIPDRATAFVAHEGGNFTLATPGRNGYETGIPEVDAALGHYRYKLVDGMG